MKQISVIIPCRDEAPPFVNKAILKLRHELSNYRLDIMVIEGGSYLLKGRLDRVRYYNIKKRGLGRALKFGIVHAKCEDVFFLSADMSYDLSFVKSALLQNAAMVLGSKALADSVVNRPLKRKIISKIYHLKTKIIDGISVGDVTGVKLYRKSKVILLLDSCSSSGIDFEVQLQQQAEKHGLKVKEIPVIVAEHRDRGVLRWLH